MMKQYIYFTLFLVFVFLVSACTKSPVPFQRQIIISANKEKDSTRNSEAREDSMEMVLSLAENATFENIIWADTETDAVESLLNEDAADDPAIWVNRKDAEKSLVLGTQKKSGLYAYDLNGKIKQFIPAGNINNVDVRSGFTYNGSSVTLVAGSNRSINAISLFFIDEERGILSDTIANIKSTVDEVYGLCMYRSASTHNFYVFVNGKGGLVEQWLIYSVENSIGAELVRTFSVSSQPEGMVANDSTGILYLGVEEQGICSVSAEQNHPTDLFWLPNSSDTSRAIKYDIEGLSIYYGRVATYLFASIQGNFSYAIWDITESKNSYLTSFVIWESFVDGVEETDGIDITSIPLGDNYPEGLLVVQDGFNYDGDSLKTQNFKYISLEKILPFIE